MIRTTAHVAAFFFVLPLLGAGNPAFAPDAPPILSRISLSDPDARNEVTISGAAGATIGGGYIAAINVDTGHVTTASVAEDGSFSARLIAPPGTNIEIKADPQRKILPRLAHRLNEEASFGALPGTLLRVPEPPSSGTTIRFAGAGVTASMRPWFTVDGTINKHSFTTGEELVVEVTVTLHGSSLPASPPMSAEVNLGLARVTTAEGDEVSMKTTFASNVLTPTELAIERNGSCGRKSFASRQVAFGVPADGRATLTTTLRFNPPPDIDDGYYQPYLFFHFNGVPAEQVAESPAGGGPDGAFRRYHHIISTLPIVRVGTPAEPRLFAALFADQWSEASLGIRAVEDRSRYGIASHIGIPTDAAVLPRFDAGRSPIRYRFEPHLPLVSLSDRGDMVSPPRIPFRFPSGSLAVRIKRPDGSTIDLGPAPLRQARFISPAKRSGQLFDSGSRHPADIYQVSTMDPRFELAFDQYGLHAISLEGHIEDLRGTRWHINGTYEVLVAETLVLDTAVLPGTPFEAGGHASFGVSVIPPVPARIEMRLRTATGPSGARVVDTSHRGFANRFGFYRPDSFAFSEPSEYRADIHATWTDPSGVVWAGSRTWGGIVAPSNGPLVVNGLRGHSSQQSTRQPWYFQSSVTGLRPDSHPNFPFFGKGDIVWAGQPTQGAMITALTFQDTGGDLGALFLSRCRDPGTAGDLAAGEGPLISSRADGLDTHFDPASIDLWVYGYVSVQRPLIRVREMIGEHSVITFGYWQFAEQYGAQKGVGAGDRTNDFKFLFGGAVFRGSALSKAEYAIYGASWVHLPPDDPAGTRAFPPFQGNGGGPSGGPLFMLKGKPIDIFFHPTGVRPGTILHRGELASFAGYSAPTLPSKVEIVVTAPSGVQRTLRGQANKIGYSYDPATDFRVYESGVWRARASPRRVR